MNPLKSAQYEHLVDKGNEDIARKVNEIVLWINTQSIDPSCERNTRNIRNKNKHWDTMVNILDNCFPKGECKERGKALVMLAYIEMMLQGIKFNENGEPNEM